MNHPGLRVILGGGLKLRVITCNYKDCNYNGRLRPRYSAAAPARVAWASGRRRLGALRTRKTAPARPPRKIALRRPTFPLGCHSLQHVSELSVQLPLPPFPGVQYRMHARNCIVHVHRTKVSCVSCVCHRFHRSRSALRLPSLTHACEVDRVSACPWHL